MSPAILFHFLCAQHVSDINIYIPHQELATILFNYHIGRIVLGSMCVGVSVWLGWSGTRVAGFFMSLVILFHFLCAQHVSDINIYIHHQELATILLNYHIGCFVLGSMCVGDLVRLGLSGFRVVG